LGNVRTNGSAVIPAQVITKFGAAPLDFLNEKYLENGSLKVTKGLLSASGYKEMFKRLSPRGTAEGGYRRTSCRYAAGFDLGSQKMIS